MLLSISEVDCSDEVKILFKSYIKAVNSGIMDKTRVPGENYRPSTTELRDVIAIRSVPNGI